MRSKVLIWIAGLSLFIVAVLIYLIQTGERGLSSKPLPVRSLNAVRMNPTDSKDLGWNPKRLDEVFDYAATLSSDTLVIVTKGKTVASFGDLKKPYHTHSIRKAFLSALVGQHLGTKDGQINLDASLQELGIDDSPKPLTSLQKQAKVEHLIMSISGINHPAAAGGGFVSDTDSRLGNEENKPGTKWAYNNWDYNALTTIFEKRTGMKIFEGFKAGIAKPLSMEDFGAESVSYLENPELSQHRAAMFQMSARDLVKFGQLYLNKGRISNKQIIPASWIENITNSYTKTGRDDLRWGHGFLWWIPNPETGLPKGTFWAFGLGNQAVFVIPRWDTVIVHQSDTTEFIKRFIPMIAKGQSAEAALEQMIISCKKRANRNSEYCIEDRFITRSEFEKLISLIVKARM